MRLAVSGAHGVGKTTLIDDFVAAHPGYAREEEPYWALAQQGVVFADGATIPDLEEQLGASAGLILARADDRDIVFDRCPVDFIAYLEVTAAGEGIEWTPSGRLLARIDQAIATLDLLVFVPLTRPDEIAVRIERPKLRAKVDQELAAMLREDTLSLFESGRPRLVEISGSRTERVDRLTAALG